MTTSPYLTLFSSFRLGHVEARNRIVSTSRRTNLAEWVRVRHAMIDGVRTGRAI